MSWSGPEHWLALAASAPEAFEERLHACVGDDAALCDQSDSRVVLELSGPRLLDTLAKGVGVDLHPSQFGPGCVALTGVSHIGVQIWRDESGGSFHVLVPRTYFASFWSWLSASAAEYGCEVTDAA